MCQSGMGVTIVFEDSEFAGKVTGISGGDLVREWYDSTHFGSAAGTDFDGLRWMEQCPGDLGSVNDIVVEILYDMDLLPPIDQPVEEITIQSPPKAGQTTGARLVFQGGMSQYGGASFAMRDLRRGQYTLKVTGPPEFTAGAA
jgi:hypothetical protein